MGSEYSSQYHPYLLPLPRVLYRYSLDLGWIRGINMETLSGPPNASFPSLERDPDGVWRLSRRCSKILVFSSLIVSLSAPHLLSARRVQPMLRRDGSAEVIAFRCSISINRFVTRPHPRP
jgi:hypothetical protein